MKLTYRVLHEDGHWVAECLEIDAAGEGLSAAEAVLTLRDALAERFVSDAVAPPSRRDKVELDLTQVPSTMPTEVN